MNSSLKATCSQCSKERPEAEFWRKDRYNQINRRDVCRWCARSNASKMVWRRQGYKKKRPLHHDRWMPAEIEIIKKYGGAEGLSKIRERLETIGSDRTEAAIELRAYQMGMSLWHPGLATWEIARQLGVTTVAVKTWDRQDKLTLRPLENRYTKRHGRCKMRIADEDQVFAFLSTYPWMVNPKNMPQGKFRSFLELLWKRHPWFTAKQAHLMTGIAITTIRRYAQARLVSVEQSNTGHGTYLFPPEAIAQFKEIAAEWPAYRRASKKISQDKAA